MRKGAVAAAGAALGALVTMTVSPASADVLVSISKSSQRMSVLVDGTARYNWKVSTGAKRYRTPTGVFKPEWMVRKWKSRKYNNAPMPHSIFFHEGYAIHGTTEVARLGRIASHGCVRLHPDNAKKLYSLVEKQMAYTRVVVSDDVIVPPSNELPKKKPNQFIADNTVGEEPAANTKIALEAMALAPAAAAAPQDMLAAEKADARQTAKPKHARTARIQRRGFHW